MRSRIGFVAAFIAFALSVSAQKYVQKVERVGNSLYLSEGHEMFLVDTEVITLKLKSSQTLLDPDIKAINFNRLGYIDIKVPEGVDVEKYADELRSTGKFEIVEFNSEARCSYVPNDVYAPNQWHIGRINLYSGWNIVTGAPNVKVAIIDSGVELSHPDLGYTLSDGYSQIDSINGVNYTQVSNAHVSPVFFHGTFVAGILGAKTNNVTCIAGVSGGDHSKGLTIIPYCVCNSATFTSASIDDAIIDAIDKGARVINISLSLASCSSINEAIEDAYANDVTIVCASARSDLQSARTEYKHLQCDTK